VCNLIKLKWDKTMRNTCCFLNYAGKAAWSCWFSSRTSYTWLTTGMRLLLIIFFIVVQYPLNSELPFPCIGILWNEFERIWYLEEIKGKGVVLPYVASSFDVWYDNISLENEESSIWGFGAVRTRFIISRPFPFLISKLHTWF